MQNAQRKKRDQGRLHERRTRKDRLRQMVCLTPGRDQSGGSPKEILEELLRKERVRSVRNDKVKRKKKAGIAKGRAGGGSYLRKKGRLP